MSTFHTPQSIIDHGVRRDDSAEHQIRIVTISSGYLAVSCTCRKRSSYRRWSDESFAPIARITDDREAWAAYNSFHQLDTIQQSI